MGFVIGLHNRRDATSAATKVLRINNGNERINGLTYAPGTKIINNEITKDK